ncbi:MAG: hypothetical protein WDW21_06375, partial [Neisseriaceae bacterium]
LVLLKDSKGSSEDFKEEPKLELGNSNGPEEDERNGREEDSKGKPELDESGDKDEGPMEELGLSNTFRGLDTEIKLKSKDKALIKLAVLLLDH